MLNKNKYILTTLFLGTIISRLFSIYFFGDSNLDNEWGIILLNWEKEGVFGYRIIEGQIVPNIFMPPLYALFLALINYFINDIEILPKVVLYIQLILSTISVFIIYRILTQLFSKRVVFLSSFVFSFFPLNVYSVSQISSITLQVFLLSIFFYFIISFDRSKKNKYLIGFSASSSLLILLRAEFILFFIFSLVFIYSSKKNLKNLFIASLITLVLISPYMIRNYIIFDKIVITQSFGYNLWKGNNENLKVDGYYLQLNPELNKKINEIGYDIKYDLLVDKVYEKEAIKFIKNNPSEIIKLYFKKIFAFLFVDLNSSYPQYYNFAHLMPKILITLTTFFGIYFGIRNRIFNYFSSYYFLNLFLLSTFFILPRYSLAILPCQIILSAVFFERILRRF
tara:strand:- start:8208 stop:9392 length:1185 start_codon:yes stop_codon:yes gene_type:complete